MIMFRSCAVVLLLLSVSIPQARAQSFEAGVHFASADWSAFDDVDRGVGGRLTWRATPRVGVDADVTWYPGDYPHESIAFSGSRIEALFGATYGPRIDRVRPFLKASTGFLRSSEAPEGFPCILIFPPPLNCLMAAGHTMPAFEFGGGVELDVTDRAFLRVDAGARMLRYPGPAFENGLSEIHDDDFWGTALRFTIGVGLRLPQ
jgi:hypothetical protein